MSNESGEKQPSNLSQEKEVLLRKAAMTYERFFRLPDASVASRRKQRAASPIARLSESLHMG